MNKTTPIAALCLALFAGSALSATDAAPARAKQQNRMATCSKEAKAKDLHKAERRQFMSSCMTAKV